MELPKLTYNAAAYYAEAEKYPQGILKAISSGDRDGFEAICWALSEFSTQTELIRRDMGYEKRPILTPEYFSLRLSFPEMVAARAAIINAVFKGMDLENEDEEVDEVLLELQKKTESKE